jgi:hypothetical protein
MATRNDSLVRLAQMKAYRARVKNSDNAVLQYHQGTDMLRVWSW